MLNTLTVDRRNLPEAFREWLESGGQAKGILLFREENGQIILEKLDNVDLSMIERVRANMIKYRSALQRLAE